MTEEEPTFQLLPLATLSLAAREEGRAVAKVQSIVTGGDGKWLVQDAAGALYEVDATSWDSRQAQSTLRLRHFPQSQRVAIFSRYLFPKPLSLNPGRCACSTLGASPGLTSLPRDTSQSQVGPMAPCGRGILREARYFTHHASAQPLPLVHGLARPLTQLGAPSVSVLQTARSACLSVAQTGCG